MRVFLALLLLLPATAFAASDSVALVDTLNFGQTNSESAHQVAGDHSTILAKAALGQPARELEPIKLSELPSDSPDLQLPKDEKKPSEFNWQGGTVDFVMKVDPDQQNYFTVRFWGSDINKNCLILYCEGKQVGYRLAGDIDILDTPSEAPGYPGRFFYTTNPLPLSLTKGKTMLHFEIRSTGPIWPYGTNWVQFQKMMETPSRAIYQVYTHTNGYFVPPRSEVQGTAPAPAPVRTAPGEEILDQVKTNSENTITKFLSDPTPIKELEAEFLARAYRIKSLSAYQNPAVVKKIIESGDDYFIRYRKNPKLAQFDPSAYNGGWLGLGPLAHAVWLTKAAISAELDEKIQDENGQDIVRRTAWAEMFKASRDWHQQNRRLYSNQTMINDLYFYFDNRALEALASTDAQPEEQIRHYLYQSIGLEPWLGSDTPNGPQKPMGSDYWEVTSKGLTKELGFVGYYGEVLDWVTSIYKATAENPDDLSTADPKIKDQLNKMTQARSYFRYPQTDDDGFRAMRVETIIGWRDAGHYPGTVTYNERPTWDASPLYAATATLDPRQIGVCQQMMEDNQFYSSLAGILKEKSLRANAGLLEVPDQVDLFKKQPANPTRLPMTDGQPDFVFADEEDGVLALKHGSDKLYISLYWRARNAVNFLARVHYMQPTIDHIAVVKEDITFNPTGEFCARPDWTTNDFGNGGFKYPGELHSAEAGEQLPIAQFPESVQSLNDGVNWTSFKPGQENPYVGRGQFYHLRYGPYLIAMNATKDQSFKLTLPTKKFDELTHALVQNGTDAEVPPQSTVVLFIAPGK